MKFKKLENRSVPLGKMLLFCCITLGLMTALSAAAAPEKDVCTGAEMGSYAKLVFCLPPEVVVEPETMAEANYTGGREVAASMLLDGNRVGLHLLYPCQAPQKELKPADLKPYLEAYDPIMAQATYNESVHRTGSLGADRKSDLHRLPAEQSDRCPGIDGYKHEREDDDDFPGQFEHNRK